MPQCKQILVSMIMNRKEKITPDTSDPKTISEILIC